jgi:integrase
MAGIDLPRLVKDRDRHGNRRYYARVKNVGKLRLRSAPGSREFLAEYQAALEKLGISEARASAQGTWKWLCQRYLASPEFGLLDDRTKRVRRAIIEKTWKEPMTPGSPLTFANCPVSRMTAKHIRVLRDRKAEHPEAANSRLKAIRQVFILGLEAEPDVCRSNPARDVPYLKTSTGGFHTWTVEEVRQYEAVHEIGTMARMALAVLAFTGQRRSDAVKFGRQHEVKDSKSLAFTQFKGRNRKPVKLVIPILPELRDVIDQTPRKGMTYIETEFGRPFTGNGFGNRFRKWCDDAELPHCTAHGLRKAGATIAAENGATERQLMDIFGWSTAKQVGVYTRAVRQEKVAGEAMHLIVPKAEA